MDGFAFSLHGLVAFVFWYPLLMSAVWMVGAAISWWRRERPEPPWYRPPVLAEPPGVSVLIP